MNNCPSMNAPTISVLMSCYNGSRWLAQAIESVLAQTIMARELILVDDGSQDATLEIIRSYAQRYEQILAVPKPNTGLADSLNVGLAKASGTWVARLDQDDIAEPERLERQLAYVQANPAVVLLGTGSLEIDANERPVKRNFYPATHKGLVNNLERLKRFFPHSSAFYRADLARQVGGYNRRIHRCEDWRLWLELSLRGEIACLPECLVRIRKHPMQMSLDERGTRQFFDHEAATVCHFLRRFGAKDPSTDGSDQEWAEFLAWLEDRVRESGALSRHEAWGTARAAFFSAKSKIVRTVEGVGMLLRSGNAWSILQEKVFGSSFPAELAKAWVARADRMPR